MFCSTEHWNDYLKLPHGGAQTYETAKHDCGMKIHQLVWSENQANQGFGTVCLVMFSHSLEFRLYFSIAISLSTILIGFNL